jgi:acyl-CoA reductase-like NAD-dependent aldehyde dehydrogenase
MIDEAQIDAIVEQVMVELRQGERVRHGPTPEPVQGPPPARRQLQHASNLFPDVDSAVAAARQGFDQLQALPLEVRESMISQIRRVARENAQILAYEAWEETGMGRYEDKIQKNLLNANKTPGTEFLQSTSWSGDRGLTLVEWAPYGLIGAIIPSTNPTSTVICNTIAMVAAGNAVIFNAHPGAKSCSNHAVQLMNEAVIDGGGPANLVVGVAEPTIETAQEIMAHKGIRVLTVTGGIAVVRATGGIAVVRAAMASGKRAICAGPGNPPVVVDETADLEQAGRDVVFGASFDNNIICTDEKTLIAVDSIADELKQVMARYGAYELDSGQFGDL